MNTRFRGKTSTMHATNRAQDTAHFDVLSMREPEVALLAANGVSVFSAMNRVQDTSHFNVLSVRERQVALLAAKGLTNKLIARELSVAEGTVKIHLHNVYQKLGIRGRYALAGGTGNLPLQPSRGRSPLCQSDDEGRLITTPSTGSGRRQLLVQSRPPDSSDASLLSGVKPP
jgi:DNA-binding CsgD family transcriptional regulator